MTVDRRRREFLRRAGRAIAAITGGLLLKADPVAAGPVTTDRYGDQNQTLPRKELPEFAKSRGPNVSGNYRYAAEQGKSLEYIPCYCGCGGIDHRNNRDCYIKSENRDGTVTYTSHAAT